jgi:hypothetical protein
MSTKNKHKDQKRHRKLVTKQIVADVVGCGVSTVKQVLSPVPTRNPDTDLGQRIEIADALLEEKFEQAITDVKKIVHKTNK